MSKRQASDDAKREYAGLVVAGKVEPRQKPNPETGSGHWCACGREIPQMEAAWGQAVCRPCRKDSGEGRKHPELAVVPLEDIDDVWGYVSEYVYRRFSQLPPNEIEEYIAEGLAITFRLHAESWRREQTPSFRLYLSTYLWNRLRDYRRKQVVQSGEAHWTNHRVRWIGRESLDQMAEAGHELSGPDVEDLAA